MTRKKKVKRVKREIGVIQEGDELFFKEKTHQVPFRRIRRFEQLMIARTQLTVKRNGKTLAKSGRLGEAGGYFDDRFHGLENLFEDRAHRSHAQDFGIPELSAKDLKVGDVVIVEADDMPDEFSFAQYDEHLTKMLGLFHSVLDEHPEGILMGELGEEMAKKAREQSTSKEA